MRRTLLTAAIVCLAGGPLPALQPPQPPAPQFRSGVDLVHLDVSVLDRNRRPVRGLIPADFIVLENGVAQELSVFTPVEIADAVPAGAPWVREIASDVGTNEGIEERRLFLVIIDDAMIQSDVRGLQNTKEIALKVIDRIGPSDLAAVLFTLDNRGSQDYTSDRMRLRAAVDRFGVGFRDMGGDDSLYWISSADVVRRAVEALTSLPDRRKSVIYIGQGVPVDLGLVAEAQGPGLLPGELSAIARQGLAGQIQQLMLQTFRHARRANVNVYTIDVCGLRVPLPVVPGRPPPTCQPGTEIDYLHALAANTGARAVTETNDFEPGVQTIFDENASYYLLGYQPSSSAQDGRFRRIEVRVNRPGVDVRTRSGYQPERPRDAERRRAALAKQPLGAALAGLLPKSDLPLEVAAVPIPVRGRRESAVAIVVGVRQPIRANDAGGVERVDLQVSAYNTDGRHFGSSRYRADVALRPGATGLAEYEVLARLDLRPGRYQLRIAGHVGSLVTSGSLYYDVDVPDVTRTALSLTPLMVSATPGPVAAPRDALAAIVPIVPTARRTFNSGQQVSAFTRVHQGGRSAVAPVALRLRLEDQEGGTVLERTQDLAPERFDAARAADVSIALPVAQLASGDYLLTVETASPGSPVRRVIRFRVE